MDAAGAGRDHHLAVCAIVKDEAPHLLEWIAFHHALGVDKFFLYDNASTDDTVARLAPLARAGLVELTSWPMRAGQVPAYDDFARRHGRHVTWAAFIDADEFINPFAFDSIPAWLATVGDAAAVAPRWLNFGPSDHQVPPPGLLIEAYRTRLPDDAPVHGHVKSIVRMGAYRSSLGAHAFAVDGPVVDERGLPVEDAGGSYAIQPVRPPEGACLNHYYTRSRQDWAEKLRRGRADNADDADDPRRPSWFDHYAAAAVVRDDRILRFAPRTREMLDRLAALPG